ncbi:hypothetical protein DPEC_G00137820 [Dallia pectoralis]|uniref:Uncharacterized protein n=1 Tax=Dallia pectoralis TaxID=75939 RepID=A0ACC2GM17_DALPE|nr:hypothetical protein DPEC_G00137820 [Dallia pectoralis]
MHHRARVQAFTQNQRSNWTLSMFFNPLTDTMLGPPLVSVSGCGNCLRLNITPPTSRGMKDSQILLLYRGFTCLVRRTRDGSQFSFTATGDTVIGYLEPRVEYCVTVTASSVVNTHSIQSQPHCAFTSPAGVNTMTVLLSGLCVLSLLVALSCGVVVYVGRLLYLQSPVVKTVLWSLYSAPR